MFFYSITALIKSVKKLSEIKSLTRIEKNQDNTLLNQQAKTTNINILLNRVRLDKKKTFRKRFIFTFIITILVSVSVAYLIL